LNSPYLFITLIKKYINNYQHHDWYTQNPTQKIFSHDRRSLKLMSSSIQVTSATTAGTTRQSENKYIEDCCHNLKKMQKANDGLCGGVQRQPHTVITHTPLKVWK